MEKEVKGLDITRLVMSILAIMWAIILFVIVCDYFIKLKNGSSTDVIFLIFLLPIFFAMSVCLVINALLGLLGVHKYLKNKNIPLNERKVNIAKIIIKIIVALLGLSLPMLVVYICDITESNKKKELENN